MGYPKCIFLLLFLFISLSGKAAEAIRIPEAHTASIDKMALFVKKKCATPADRLWTVQTWMSENMEYDFEKYATHGTTRQVLLSREVMAQEAFVKRRGVCEDFASLFLDFAKKMGVEAYFVSGSLEGEAHAWVACVIDGNPYLFDPTWCSGSYNVTSKVYVKKLAPFYFMAHPDSLQLSHKPLDPLLQFSRHPVTYDGIRQEADFVWEDTLSAFLQKDTLAQWQDTYRRSVGNGKPSPVLSLAQSVLKRNIDNRLLSSYTASLNQMAVRIIELHNMLVDLNYLSHNVELSVTNSVKQMEGELDGMEAAIKARSFAKDQPGLRELREFSSIQRSRLRKCTELMKRKKGMNRN